jgi:MFS transporter, MHS family, proline/betaine transporter
MSQFTRLVIAIGIGNALEWFDFAIYGALADIIGYHFFPTHAERTALLASFSVYCSAFLMRPLGGILMGYIGDTYGRKIALEISIALMLIPGFFMGCLPTYNQVGYFATLLLVFLRMLQGLAVGGEMIGAFIYTIEACEPTQRSLWGGVCKSTALCGTIIGMGFVIALRDNLSEKDLYSWGWRIPFLFSVLLGLFGVYMRKGLQESEEFHQHKQEQSAASSEPVSFLGSVKTVITTQWREMVLTMLVSSFWCAGYYASFIWMVYYTSDLMIGGGVTSFDPWIVNLFMISLLVLLLPLGGYVSDVYAKAWPM